MRRKGAQCRWGSREEQKRERGQGTHLLLDHHIEVPALVPALGQRDLHLHFLEGLCPAIILEVGAISFIGFQFTLGLFIVFIGVLIGSRKRNGLGLGLGLGGRLGLGEGSLFGCSLFFGFGFSLELCRLVITDFDNTRLSDKSGRVPEVRTHPSSPESFVSGTCQHGREKKNAHCGLWHVGGFCALRHLHPFSLTDEGRRGGIINISSSSVSIRKLALFSSQGGDGIAVYLVGELLVLQKSFIEDLKVKG